MRHVLFAVDFVDELTNPPLLSKSESTTLWAKLNHFLGAEPEEVKLAILHALGSPSMRTRSFAAVANNMKGLAPGYDWFVQNQGATSAVEQSIDGAENVTATMFDLRVTWYEPDSSFVSHLTLKCYYFKTKRTQSIAFDLVSYERPEEIPF